MGGEIRFSGVVCKGLRRGRRLGFPTANLELSTAVEPHLERGVYVGEVRWDGGEEYGALLNIGVRPTFEEGKWTVEAYILDFSGDLYGKEVQVTLLKRLRDERRFDSERALVEQIESDVKQARAFLGERKALHSNTEV